MSPPIIQVGPEPGYQRGHLQTAHPSHLDHASGGLSLKIAFYVEHFLELRYGFIVAPPYTCKH
jgi:hypothetical protein